MRIRTKIVIGVLICYGAAALAERFTSAHGYYSRLTSSTHVEDKVTASAGEQVFTLQVEKPVTRWVPLLKYGETVHFHHYRHQGAAAPQVERYATTRTTLFVIGLCSPEQFEKLANGPYEAVHSKYLNR
jgi:hypothetical protein